MGSSAIQSRHSPPPTPSVLESWTPLLPGFDGASAARTLSSGALHHSSFPHWVSGPLKLLLPPLSLCALCSACFCDLHVAEIFVEPNYFYTQAFSCGRCFEVSFLWLEAGRGLFTEAC